MKILLFTLIFIEVYMGGFVLFPLMEETLGFALANMFLIFIVIPVITSTAMILVTLGRPRDLPPYIINE